jgi:hypothetical protein
VLLTLTRVHASPPSSEFISTNALDANPLFQSNIVNPANDPIHRGDCPSRCGRMYDFLDAVISPTDGSVWASFVDTCTHTDWNGVVTNCNMVRAAGFNAGTGSHGVSGDMRGLAAKELSGRRCSPFRAARATAAEAQKREGGARAPLSRYRIRSAALISRGKGER